MVSNTRTLSRVVSKWRAAFSLPSSGEVSNSACREAISTRAAAAAASAASCNSRLGWDPIGSDSNPFSASARAARKSPDSISFFTLPRPSESPPPESPRKLDFPFDRMTCASRNSLRPARNSGSSATKGPSIDKTNPWLPSSKALKALR